MKQNNGLIAVLGFVLTALILTVSVAVLFYLASSDKEVERIAVSGNAARTVVIDAGHGGMDGGAVALDGTLEKDINLEIAQILSALLKASGFDVVMTRESDIMLDNGSGVGSAKMRDLKRRLEITSGCDGALAVSIHCNKFPLTECKGMQVYYSDVKIAEETANAVQNAFLLIDPSNKRKIKKADSSIYLLHRAVTPTVLVECGFLSNEAELQKLKTEDYKKKLALVIMSGIDAWSLN